MGIGKLKVVLTEEAQAFLDAQPFKAQQKIYYNIFKVEEGVMKVNIFKKLENTDIWEFRTLYNGISNRLFSFLGHGVGHVGYRHARYSQENSKDTIKGDCQGRRGKERVF